MLFNQVVSFRSPFMEPEQMFRGFEQMAFGFTSLSECILPSPKSPPEEAVRDDFQRKGVESRVIRPYMVIIALEPIKG